MCLLREAKCEMSVPSLGLLVLRALSEYSPTADDLASTLQTTTETVRNFSNFLFYIFLLFLFPH